MLAVVLGFAVIIAAVSPVPGARTRPGVYLSTALAEPLKVFIARYGRLAGPILALICLYRLSDFVLNIMNPFYLDLGFTLTEVAEVRKVFVCARDVAPEWHIRMQAAFQRHCDSSIAKTINFPQDAPREKVRELFLLAYREGVKGVTVYRDKSREEQPMALEPIESEVPRACGREPAGPSIACD